MLYLRVALLGPGVVLHEFSHYLLCLLSGVRVRKAVFFRFGSPAGFVIHDEPDLYRQVFAVVGGPFFLNTTVAVAFWNLAMREAVRAEGTVGYLLVATLMWLGASAALQAIPSSADAANLFHGSNQHLLRGNLFALVGYPVALAVYLIQLARPVGSDWGYSLAVFYLAYRGFVGLT